jgi:hypothetical protein
MMNPYVASMLAPFQDEAARVADRAIKAGCSPKDVCEYLAVAIAIEVARHLSPEDDPEGLRRAADGLVAAEHETVQLAGLLARRRPA